MTASANDIADLRRMINEPTQTPYTNALLARCIEKFPVMDDSGKESGDADWIAAYDLHAAAADLWAEKASLVQMYYDFQADGARYSESQLYEMAMDKSRFHAARRKMGHITTHKKPDEIADDDDLIYDPEYAWWRV
jgi:hypothetical protein